MADPKTTQLPATTGPAPRPAHDGEPQTGTPMKVDGAFAITTHPGDLDELRDTHPTAAAEIERLRAEVAAIRKWANENLDHWWLSDAVDRVLEDAQDV